jgi:hypothetical protein
MLDAEAARYTSMIIPDVVFVLLFGDFVAYAENVLARSRLDKEKFFAGAQEALWDHIARIRNTATTGGTLPLCDRGGQRAHGEESPDRRRDRALR